MTIGWIGTGIMGAPMAGHLQAAGHRLSVYNRTRSKAAGLEAAGATWCESPSAVAESAEVVFSIVGYPADVEATYFGPDGLIHADGECRTVVDMTTSLPSLAKRISAEFATRGVASLDAPVSGGDVGASAGTLAIMVGGERETFDTIEPLFAHMGKTIRYMGPAGSGQNTKMCNQILVAGTMIGVCESLLYAYRQDMDPEAVIGVIGSGAARSFLINNLGPRIAQDNFDPGFIVDHFVKDMGIALQESAAAQLALPGLSLVHQLYVALQAQGGGRLGTQGLMLALRQLNGESPLA
ncbi:MAG: 3-hydroxyisobutyrate dehydrogenase [Rhodothermales bacterium]|jgi:3-hydroxyisobutyrate dehydrogenase